ncbi:hypothetical protein K7711_40820 [Nocardia sp. CA2R105]|uniref:hypothetical protein n=1 Tax=Nocardia coffeae TaxID=2873381 RepID=UPI001CA71380|nr:hypothetical protein [Nocardia coffeae]MBY8862871.1 hypothetical protein [Nocardia coffeae]
MATIDATQQYMLGSFAEAPADIIEFNRYARDAGWSDGLPLIPPTEERVRAMLAAVDADPDEVVAELPPSGASCTLAKLAANAVMAGAPPTALPLLRTALAAMAEPEFDLHALNATTGSAVPALVVNGKIRHELEIPFGAGCLGGAEGGAPALGRALRLTMRNIAGQRIGVTSQSVYGTPGRVAGIVFGEWEERSPWAPLAQRRSVPGDAVTVYGAMGTVNICDIVATTGALLLEIIGKSLAYPGANGFLTSTVFSEVLVAVNPIWAEIIGLDFPDANEVAERLWSHAALPLDHFPETHRGPIEALGRVDEQGQVHLTPTPADVIVVTAGGLGGLHAAVLHSWGATRSQTRAVR